MNRRRALALARLVLIALVALPFVANPEVAQAASAVNGGGSGFAALEIDQWRADTAKAP
jgi:hypothetical protein